MTNLRRELATNEIIPLKTRIDKLEKNIKALEERINELQKELRDSFISSTLSDYIRN